MIEKEPGTDWRDLQRRVASILAECGLRPEVGKTIGTTRGEVEIDVYAIDPTTTPPALYLCECKRWTTPVPQGEVQTFRTVVADTGAHYGLFISASGFQAGAYEVVRHTNIHLLSWLEFQEMFVERWCRQYWVPTFRTGADRLAAYVDPVSSDAAVKESRGEPLEPEEAVGLMAQSMWGEPFVNHVMIAFIDPLGTELPPARPLSPAIWQLRDSYRKYLPTSVREAMHLRELLDSLLEFAAEWIKRTGRA